MARVLRIILLVLFAALGWQILVNYAVVQSVVARAQAPEPPPDPIYLDKQGRRINEADFHVQQGYERAEKDGITSHAECRQREQHLARLGCQRYVTEHKTFPPYVHQGNWDSGKTTAQCRDEVNAYWEAYVQEDRERGLMGSSDPFSHVQENWRLELRQCENYDNFRGVHTEERTVEE